MVPQRHCSISQSQVPQVALWHAVDSVKKYRRRTPRGFDQLARGIHFQLIVLERSSRSRDEHKAKVATTPQQNANILKSLSQSLQTRQHGKLPLKRT